MRTIRRRIRLAALAGVATVAAGCQASTEPEPQEPFDTEAALADHEAVRAALQAPELDAFRALAGRTPFGDGPAGVDALASAGTAESDGRSFSLALARRLAEHATEGGTAAAPIISDTHRGSTFAYDPEQGEYGVDPERTGAPENGVRFILYEVDAEGVPNVDEEIGFADLVDEGDGSVEDVVLHLTAVVDGDVVVDYRTALDDDGSRGLLTVHGFLVGDRVRLDFDIEAVGRRDGDRTMLDIAFELRVDQRDFSVTGTVRGVEEGGAGEGDIDVVVRHRTRSLRLDVRGSDGSIEGSVFLNGDLFATVSGPVHDPTFLGRSGEPLTFWQRLALHRIVDRLEDVFDLLEDLVDPVGDLVFLAIVL